MDDRVLAKITERLADPNTHTDAIWRLAGSFPGHDPESIKAGIIAGRSYSTFYYQTRRLLHRDPTPEEFDEFVEILTDVKDRTSSR